jgi:3-phosphoshikimate 1-carboxyvinyltransferase
MTEYLRLSGSKPKNFDGTIILPPSKSYLHRALFVASLCKTQSRIKQSGVVPSDDVLATIRTLKSLGQSIERVGEGASSTIKVLPREISSGTIFAGESGTTARFAIAFAGISTDGKRTIVTGDKGLLMRPMQPLLDALAQIGVRCYSRNSDGKLPVVVESTGIEGGDCVVDGSISSQFISALLIACTHARNDTTLKILDVRKAVSFPYIDATISVLNCFRFEIQSKRSGFSQVFFIKANQTEIKGRPFSVPGDMSSAAALIGATLAARGRIRMYGANLKVPQADSAFLNIAEKLGAKVSTKSGSRSIQVDAKSSAKLKSRKLLMLNLKNSPDLVPVVVGTAAAVGRDVKITNVAHLRFKESDRLGTLAREYKKLGLEMTEKKDSLTISAGKFQRKGNESRSDLLSSHNDHRILMSLTIAGISGKFGEFSISNPSCVKKSYPSFVSDLKSLMQDERVISLIKRR